MAPRFVVPYRKDGKNDGNDAEAICEAVARPGMRFVPVTRFSRCPQDMAECLAAAVLPDFSPVRRPR